MIKKAIIGGVVVLLLGLFFFGRGMMSYVQTSAGYLRDSVSSSVPVEFQLERARGMIRDLTPVIRENNRVIATEELDVERLAERIATEEAELAEDKAEMGQLSDDLATGEQQYEYGGRTYSAERVRTDLQNRLRKCRTNEATLEDLRNVLEAREFGLEAARRQLDGMVASKAQLEVEIESIEARMKMVEAAKTTCEYAFDDSRLGRIKELVADLKIRIEVDARLVNAEDNVGEIPVNQPAAEDIVDQVADYLAEEEIPGIEVLAQE